jgi:hypothetical protein
MAITANGTHLIFNDSTTQNTAYSGATGGQYSDTQAIHVIAYNGLTVSSNVTVANNVGAFSVGPITINSGNNVTVGANSRWVIL